MNGRTQLLLGILLGCSITYFSTLLTTHLTQSLEQDIVQKENDLLGLEQWDFIHYSKDTGLLGNQIKHVKSIKLYLNTSNLKQLEKQNCSQKNGVPILMEWILENGMPISWRLPLTLPQALSCQQVPQSNRQKRTLTHIEQDQEAFL